MSNYSVLFDLIGALARRRYQTAERSFAALGLNHTQARLITLLEQQNGEATQDALSNMLFLDRSNAGRALKGLELGGYVARRKDEADGRTRFVKMTAKGRKAAAEIARLRKEMARSFFGELTEQQAGDIADHLHKAIKFDEPLLVAGAEQSAGSGEDI